MRSPLSWFAASLLLAALPAALPAMGATILEQSIEVDIRPDGATVERTRLQVRLDTPGDLDFWSPYSLYFNTNRTIEDVSAWAKTPDGKTIKVGRKDLDTVEAAGDGVLHSSTKYRTVRFPVVPAGSVIGLEHEAKERPYFRAGLIPLAQDEPVERLRVAVRGGGAGWRWRIDGSREGLTVEEIPGGVIVTATSLPALEPTDYAPGFTGPVLRYAWGEEADWGQVGRWYERLTAPVARDAEAVRRQAREVTTGIAGKRERVAALLGYVQKAVRYVAIEVGIGGYQPFPPGAVLERKWGDCKDKAFLLIDMLREAGIEAHPALILLSEDERVDAEFPSPNEFNHAIVAIPAEGIAAPGDPVAGGFLFLDPTQELGSLRWLHPGVQDQNALVVTRQGGVLVRTPIRQELETYRLEMKLAVAPEGDARGEARLEIAGDGGSAFINGLAGSRPDEVEHVVRSILGRLLPAAEIQQPKWTTSETDVPTVTITADVRLPAFMSGAGSARSFSLPQGSSVPAASLLADRTLPVLLTPAAHRTTWRLELPEGWCPPKPDELSVDNEVGAYRQTISATGRTVEIGRTLEIRRRWVDPAAFAPLKELALADSRAGKRRIRMECGGS